MTSSAPRTPAHTIGPFHGYALPFPGGGDVAPAGHPDAITVHGQVLDGAGAPVPDALLEFWGLGPDGELPRATGSLRRDPATGEFLGRDGIGFTGFGRIPTDADGRWALRTLRPGARGRNAPYLVACVFARGLTHHLFTRVYLPEPAERLAADPLLASLAPARRATLLAVAEPRGTYRFDIHLQGAAETTFLEFA
ncbi:protocatechuate 3,4-dioxygenase subunit alpha [Streptomyces sp. UNOC14_S4]|uniref:protocatechuate 3,4-dioxygenase subunit alpha n=1 Tax=Streptomyces sp. UNOC14_S4 TaxID=2872340 RepID=UPI001E63D644|nr:protocatechuate 3,4-dioxygenase subunit alpha [Streptomyces sp. UNOC14_S4]MCC3767978.1 protocatechuate 3,4-dioxygenase subunit alpha [Streptomyces sp. UNOC14_S4]